MSMNAVVKAIQDIMRKDAGIDGDAQRIGQLSWMLFLKILDDQEKEIEVIKDKYISPIPKKYLWQSWASDPEGITGDNLMNFIDNDLFPKFKNLTDDGKLDDPKLQVVQSVFEDAYNYMKSGTLLRQVINKLNEINFNSNQDRHIFNEIYEKILKDLQSAGNAGEYYTPRAVTQFIVDVIDPKLGEKVLDPACGTGGFLTCAIEHKKNKYVKTARDWKTLQSSILGVEKKQLPHLLCATNMMLHGIDVPTNIRHGNTLSRPLRDYSAKDRVDVVITNPPFGGKEEDGIETNFPSSYRTRETADLFLLFIIQILKNGGRCGIVLPDGTLAGEGVKSRIKEKLLMECNLHTIVRLPNYVFYPYTNIATNLLFFEKGSPTKEIWYYSHPYPTDYKYTKKQSIKIEEFGSEKEWWVKREENENAWKVNISDIKNSNFNLDIKNPNKNEDEKFYSKSELISILIKDIKESLRLLEEIDGLV